MKKFILLITVLLACGTALAMAPAGPAVGADNHAAPVLCPLCHERNLNDGDELAPIRELPCHHRFCQACIDNWEHAQHNHGCPECAAVGNQPQQQAHAGPLVVALGGNVQGWDGDRDPAVLDATRIARDALAHGADEQAVRQAVLQRLQQNQVFNNMGQIQGVADDYVAMVLARARGRGFAAAYYNQRAVARNTERVFVGFARAHPQIANFMCAWKLWNVFWQLPAVRRNVPYGSLMHNFTATLMGVENTVLLPRHRSLSYAVDVFAHALATGISLYDILKAPRSTITLVDILAGLFAYKVTGRMTDWFRHALVLHHEVVPSAATYFAKWVSPLALSLYVGHRLDGIMVK